MTGNGAIYCGRNLYLPGGLSYANPGGDLVGLFDAYHRRRPAFPLALPLVGDRLVLEPKPR